jgi:hypothetical protein
MLNGATMSWKSQRQQTIALSIAEAEQMGQTAATKEALFYTQMLHELHQDPGPTITIKGEYQSCTALSKK